MDVWTRFKNHLHFFIIIIKNHSLHSSDFKSSRIEVLGHVSSRAESDEDDRLLRKREFKITASLNSSTSFDFWLSISIGSFYSSSSVLFILTGLIRILKAPTIDDYEELLSLLYLLRKGELSHDWSVQSSSSSLIYVGLYNSLITGLLTLHSSFALFYWDNN